MIDLINPGAGGVDDDLRSYLVTRKRTLVDESHAPTLEAIRRKIIDRPRAGVGLEAVVDEFETEPFRLRHARVVIGRQRDDGGIDARKRSPDVAANLDAMERRHAPADAQHVIEDHPEFYDQESAI